MRSCVDRKLSQGPKYLNDPTSHTKQDNKLKLLVVQCITLKILRNSGPQVNINAENDTAVRETSDSLLQKPTGTSTELSQLEW